MRLYITILCSTLLIACASNGGETANNCVAGKFDRNSLPCWVNKKPARGVVLNMPEHVDPSKTHEVLFKKALLELAAAKGGVEISEDSIVKKRVEEQNSILVEQRSKVITLATVKTVNGSITIKARIEDEWKHPTTRKLYLWVVSVK